MSKPNSDSESVRQYLKKNPFASYDEVKKNAPAKNLSKPWYYSIRSGLRESGEIPKADAQNSIPAPRKKRTIPKSESSLNVLMTVQVLERVDTANLNDALRSHYKEHLFPLIQKLHPDGAHLQFVFLADPPQLEIRRLIS